MIAIPKQLEYFKEYKRRLESAIGTKRTENHINKALFIVSAGTNDFVINYFTLPIRRKTFSVSGYQQFILQKATQFLQVWLHSYIVQLIVISDILVYYDPKAKIKELHLFVFIAITHRACSSLFMVLKQKAKKPRFFL